MNEIIKKFILENLMILVVGSTLFGILFWAFILWQIWKLNKRLTKLFKGLKKESLEESLNQQLKVSREMQQDIKKLFEETAALRKMATKSVQKVGVIRFNPFKDTGGDQSFAIAFLDSKDNGMVISSLHSRERTRIYSKPIEQGKCEKYKLTEEEEEAIKKARGL